MFSHGRSHIHKTFLQFTSSKKSWLIYRRVGLETHSNNNMTHYLRWSRFMHIVLHRHVCIVFLPSPPTAIRESPNCLSHEWLTFLKRCYWLVRPEYNKNVTMKDLISA